MRYIRGLKALIFLRMFCSLMQRRIYTASIFTTGEEKSFICGILKIKRDF